ncbi:hypothetical protein QE152_g33365 [Popillia japonica]|uniref:Uncharacterized protein n=1 Tax=Popillia japonica TaxID=7064 RepID=A0AAW1IWI9_POPJA
METNYYKEKKRNAKIILDYYRKHRDNIEKHEIDIKKSPNRTIIQRPTNDEFEINDEEKREIPASGRDIGVGIEQRPHNGIDNNLEPEIRYSTRAKHAPTKFKDYVVY